MLALHLSWTILLSVKTIIRESFRKYWAELTPDEPKLPESEPDKPTFGALAAHWPRFFRWFMGSFLYLFCNAWTVLNILN